MTPTDPLDLTAQLRAWKPGDSASEAQLFPAIYPLLHGMAQREVARQRGASTLGPTELLHEAYLRMADDWKLQVADRGHFFAVAARVMRRVLIDRFRARIANKRGGDVLRVQFDDVAGAQVDLSADAAQSWVLVDDLMQVLEREDPATAQVAELKLFSGLDNEEIAKAVGASTPTVVRRWRFARNWLAAQFDSARTA